MAFAGLMYKAAKVVSSSYAIIATSIAAYLLIDDFVDYQKRKRAERKAQEARNDETQIPPGDGGRRS